jgi:TonB family protein
MKAKIAALFLLVPTTACGFPAPQDTVTQGETTEKRQTRIRMGGSVMGAKIVEKVQPVYPPLARQTRIQGTVRLHAIIGRDGSIQQLEVMSGHPLLVQSALDAVKKWRYEPVLLNGEAVEVDTTIDVIYALNQDSPAPPLMGTVDPQLKADILHLLEVTQFKDRATEGGRRLFEPMRPLLRQSLPNTANREKILDSYLAKLLEVMQSDDFSDRIVAIYAKYFSDEDVKAITQFYATPTGQHFNQVMSDFLGDISKAGQTMGMENIPRILQQLCKEYPELEGSPNLCPARDSEKKSELKRPEMRPQKETADGIF